MKLQGKYSATIVQDWKDYCLSISTKRSQQHHISTIAEEKPSKLVKLTSWNATLRQPSCLDHTLFSPYGVNKPQLLQDTDRTRLLYTPRSLSEYTPIISVLICLDEEVCSVTDMKSRALFSSNWLPTDQFLVLVPSKLTSVVSQWFITISSLPHWLRFIPHCFFIFALRNGWLGGPKEPNNQKTYISLATSLNIDNVSTISY